MNVHTHFHYIYINFHSFDLENRWQRFFCIASGVPRCTGDAYCHALRGGRPFFTRYGIANWDSHARFDYNNIPFC